MFTPQNIIDSGYKHFPFKDKQMFKYADLFFQKKVKENDKTKYFINIYYYIFTDLYNKVGPATTFEVAFYLQNNTCVNVSFSGETFSSIVEIEEFFENFYKNNNFVPDIHNE